MESSHTVLALSASAMAHDRLCRICDAGGGVFEKLCGDKRLMFVMATILQAVSKVDAASVCTILKRAVETTGPDCSDWERHHEVSSHFRWHQQHEHPQRAGRALGQTDCRVQ